MSAFRSSLQNYEHSAQNIREYADEFGDALSSLDVNWDGLGEAPQVSPEELGETVQRIEALYRQDQFTPSGRDLRTLCQALWKPPYHLAGRSTFREPFLLNIRELAINSPLAALGMQYLIDWPEAEREDGPIGRFLRSQRPRMTSGWLKTANDHYLFDGTKGIEVICDKLFTDQRPLSDVLKRTGLKGSLVPGKFSEHVFTTACQGPSVGFQQEAVKRLLEYFSLGRVKENNTGFTSGSAKSALTSVLLGVGHGEMDLLEKRWRVTQLLRLFDDPRIRPARWQDVDPRLVDITKQWLAKESLEQFLKVISDSLTNPDDQRRWKYRRAFWSSYVDSGRVTEAWVHFGPNARRVAARLRARTGEEIPYGRFDSANRDHSVILMRAGDAVIAEYANIGKCWIWPSPSRDDAPELYQARQSEWKCRDAPFGQVHGGADSYNWQRQVADHLRSLGIPSTPEKQWVPR